MKGYPEWVMRAILSHADYSGVSRETPLEKALFACDEMAGFITAASLVRPSRSVLDFEAVSVVAQEASVDSHGVTIVDHTVGRGPLAIFVHSITGPWFDYRHQIVMLSERYQAVAMSTLGTDKSDKPVGIEHSASARVADDIIAIMD